MLYFAYGSNMSSARLTARVPSARMLTLASLAGYTMSFSKAGKDGSAKCGIYASGNQTERAYGVVFELDAAERTALDRCEGLGIAYDAEWVEVSDLNGTPLQVLTYMPLDHTPGLQPWAWYKQHVLLGAREFDLPQDVIEAIAATEAKTDQNAARRLPELAIYPPQAVQAARL